MTPPIRVRRHADGRIALLAEPDDPNPWLVSGTRRSLARILWAVEADVTGDGWSELFVAELPEPDGQTDAVNSDGEDVTTPYWKTSWGESVTAWIEGVETPVWELCEDLEAIRSDALKMLAAVAACEKYRSERETV